MRRKRIKPGQLVDIRLTPQERDLILERTLIDDEMEAVPAAIARKPIPRLIEDRTLEAAHQQPAGMRVEGRAENRPHRADRDAATRRRDPRHGAAAAQRRVRGQLQQSAPQQR
mgnify:CR=1 FL=1